MTINQYKKRLSKAIEEFKIINDDLTQFDPKSFLQKKKKLFELYVQISDIEHYASERINSCLRVNSTPDKQLYIILSDSLEIKYKLQKQTFSAEMELDNTFYNMLFELHKTRILDPENTARIDTIKSAVRILGEEKIRQIQKLISDDFTIIEL